MPVIILDLTETGTFRPRSPRGKCLFQFNLYPLISQLGSINGLSIGKASFLLYPSRGEFHLTKETTTKTNNQAISYLRMGYVLGITFSIVWEIIFDER